MRILVIEDDERILNLICKLLEKQTYAVDGSMEAEVGLNMALSEDYDLIIIDWMLPIMSGIQICKELRKEEITTPILFLTAKSQIEDIVEGLNIGADDYLTKPFEAQVLFARVRALLRRKNKDLSNPIITIKNLSIDTNLHEVSIDGMILNLSPKEYSLLEYLAQNIDKSLDRVSILSHVWDDNADLFSNTVDVHIRNLRRKMGDKNHKLIKTIKAKGYMLCSK